MSEKKEIDTNELIDIIGYEGIYKIHPNTGDVWSNYKKRFLKPATNSCGYKYVVLCNKENKRNHKSIHRLVYQSVNNVLDLDIDGYVVDHKDNNRINNNIDNLRLATVSQNAHNSDKISSNTGYKGIHKDKRGYYVCQVNCVGDKQKFVTKNLDIAIRFTQNMRKILHGEFANDGSPSNNTSD